MALEDKYKSIMIPWESWKAIRTMAIKYDSTAKRTAEVVIAAGLAALEGKETEQAEQVNDE